MIHLCAEESLTSSEGHDGDVLACAYLADSSCLLSGGWDGMLKLWDAGQGVAVEELLVSDKPVSSCAASPNSQRWLIGTMDGMLGVWDGPTRTQHSMFLAHTRPISGLVYTPDGQRFASVSWDRSISLWEAEEAQDGKTLGCHDDIIAGCQFSPDGKLLISWGYDGKAIIWDIHERQKTAELLGHEDRITAGVVSPDGQWLLTGSRNGQVILWELAHGQEVQTLTLGTEIRACLFLLNAQTAVVVDAVGTLTVRQVPHLQQVDELATGKIIQAATLAPSGGQLALAGCDGSVSFVTVEGFDSDPLTITAQQAFREKKNMLDRLLGRSSTFAVYECTCPACRACFELTEPTKKTTACPQCHRSIRVSAVSEAVLSS